jgi:hypothetical protein
MMKNWFASLRGALALSILALLSEAWRGFLDAMFVLPVDFSDDSLLILASLIFTLLFSLWVWLLILASRGSRAGLLAVFILNALVLLAIPVSWLLFYCPSACRMDAGIFNLANSLNLIFGFLAAFSLGLNIWRSEPQQVLSISDVEA